MKSADIFTVIRNPFDRLVLLYNFRLYSAKQRICHDNLNKLEVKIKCDIQDRQIVYEMETLGFSRWICDTRLHEERYGISITYKSQLSWCRDCVGNLRVSKFLKFEHIYFEYPSSLGITELPLIHQSRHKKTLLRLL